MKKILDYMSPHDFVLWFAAHILIAVSMVA